MGLSPLDPTLPRYAGEVGGVESPLTPLFHGVVPFDPTLPRLCWHDWASTLSHGNDMATLDMFWWGQTSMQLKGRGGEHAVDFT